MDRDARLSAIWAIIGLAMLVVLALSQCRRRPADHHEGPCLDAPATGPLEIPVRLLNRSPDPVRLYVAHTPRSRGELLATARPLSDRYVTTPAIQLRRARWIRATPQGTRHTKLYIGKSGAPPGSESAYGGYRMALRLPPVSTRHTCLRIRIRDELKWSTVEPY